MTNKRKICIVTGTRADWGLLSGIARAIKARHDTHLQIIATNMHLSPKFGNTQVEIEQDGLKIDYRVPMPVENDTPALTVDAMAMCMSGMSKALETLQPHLIVILGDRYEMLIAASAALVFNIPVAHIAGGAASYGAIDESIRHAITKMSHLHFTETEAYRRRVIQLGEQPERVFNTGAIGVYNIKHLQLLSRKQLEDDLQTEIPTSSLFVTFHPATLDHERPAKQCRNLIAALDGIEGYKVFFSYPNSDTHGNEIIELIERAVKRKPHKYVVFPSLGQLRYLSMLQYMAAVVGNSSSGIVEVPSMGIPTVNIGMRQMGRMAAHSVINCGTSTEEISQALAQALSDDFRSMARTVVNPYEQPDTLEKIVEPLCNTPLDGITVKRFYDLPASAN